ncbi:hypothetical protein ACFYZ3_00305 [Streptomyces sp. NPDC001599]|uniref:hypothetical protein n=1 Tax=Streptomyces sp. NPDC001599 TaxID=3364591 RepID=UPI0036C6BF3E
MGPEMVAGLFGLGGALVGAAVSTGAVIWQQRKTAHEAERTHLLGLAEAAANECIKISYALHKHFAEAVPERNNSAYFQWVSTGEELCRAVEEQALRFHDKAVRDFLERCHAEMYVRPEFVADPEPWPPRYVIISSDIRTVMGTVLRRQTFPKYVWEHYPDPS